MTHAKVAPRSDEFRRAKLGYCEVRSELRLASHHFLQQNRRVQARVPVASSISPRFSAAASRKRGASSAAGLSACSPASCRGPDDSRVLESHVAGACHDQMETESLSQFAFTCSLNARTRSMLLPVRATTDMPSVLITLCGYKLRQSGIYVGRFASRVPGGPPVRRHWATVFESTHGRVTDRSL
jgi:hypothetical protein